MGPIARAYGLDPDELVADTRRFFALTDAEQDAEFADALAEVQSRGDHEAASILTQGWTAIRSYG